MIIHKSFNHGWWYHYRVHGPKTEQLCSHRLPSLRDYLHHVIDNCPDEYFEKGPRSSGLRMNFDLDIKQVDGHEVSDLACKGIESAKFRTAHSNVQMFMLQNDDKTISIELPIWLLEHELQDYYAILASRDALTGHIDALRIEDGKVWVWDYKPRAAKEKYASTQVQFYALMLSQRTGIPMERFRCGYFDEDTAFIFKPIKHEMLKSALLK